MGKRFYIGLISLAAAFILIRALGPKILPRMVFSKSARTASTPFETFSKAALSHDGSYLARITSAGKQLTVEKITPDGKLEKIHSAEIDFVTPSPGSDFANIGLEWSDEGAALVATSANHLAVFDAESGYSAIIPFRTLFPSPKYGDKTGFSKAWISGGARYLVAEQRESGLFDGLIFERTGNRWKEIRELNSSVGVLNSVRFSGNGKYIAVLSSALAIEDTISGKLVADSHAVTKQIVGSYDNAIFPGETFIMQNSSYLSYYDVASKTASSLNYLPDEVIAFDKTGGRIFGAGKNGVLHVYSIPPTKSPQDMKELSLDPAYRKTVFAIWSHFQAGEYAPGTSYLMGAAVRPDGKLLLGLNHTGFIYLKTAECRLDMLDIPMLMQLDYIKTNKITSYSAYAVLIVGLIWLIIAEFGSEILSRIRSRKASAGGTVRADGTGAAPLPGTTPGIIIFGLDGRIPNSAEGMAAITLYAMHSGNAHLMMGGIPKICAKLPAEPDTEAEVVAAYQKIARESGWKVITPECKTIRGGGGSKIIAYPRTEQL
jgi:WD40 repeat protein